VSSSAAPDYLAILRAAVPPPPAERWPEPRPCSRCGAGDIPESDAICDRCEVEARKVLPFVARERQERTAARLAGRTCLDCGISWWRVSWRGDAVCVLCERKRRRP
jgi:hypothetical protein